jgi:cardiolipin synthase
VRWIPNGLSFFRLICAPIVAGLVLSGHNMPGLYWAMAAFFTDFFDGWMARKYKCESSIGRFLDAFADKALSFSIFGSLLILGKMSLSLCIVILLRDICIGLGVWWIKSKRGDQDFKPHWISKLNTAVQGMLCVGVLWGQAPVAVSALTFCLWMTTVISFAIYGGEWWQSCR